MTSTWSRLNDALAQTAERVRRGIVEIHNARYGHGTGVVVDPAGLIVTNAHVVKKRYPHVTLADGRRLRAHLVGYDAGADLAALAVEDGDLEALPLASGASAARPGDLVQALGHPWGVVGAVTTGVLVDVAAGWLEGRLHGRDWLVADLHLGPGNSGGPLLDARGHVLGINTMLIGSGLGVAVPAHRVRAFLRQTTRFEAETGAGAASGVNHAPGRSI